MILSALQSAAVRLVGRKPSTFFGASGAFELEMCDLINEAAPDIAKYQDWQALVRIATINGDGATNEIALPSDYDRQLVNTDIQQTTNWVWGYYRITDINEFLFRQNSGWQPYPGGWIIYDNMLHFSPAPSGPSEYPYISNQWATNNGTPKTAFDNDTDEFVLPERLLTLWLVWRWRENKKLDSTGDMDAFTKALDEYANKDGGSRIYRVWGRRRWPTASVPYMGTVY